MINEEIARKTLNMEVKAAKVTGKLLLNLLKKLMKEAEKLGGLEKLVNANGNEVKKVMDKAFKHALSESERKTERKESIHKNIEKFKEMAKNSLSKDKVKNKQKEQSL